MSAANRRAAVLAAGLIPLCAFATASQATVLISSAATRNMSCSGGVCSPTAQDAILNVADLEALLASSNVAVTTTGSGVQARDIAIDAALGWNSSGALILDAFRSIAINAPASVAGQSALTLTTNDGGSGGALSFQGTGAVVFANTASQLTINGTAYAPELANAIAANSSGNYALAANYDASVDGTYSAAPIATTFAGSLGGLGNTISNLTIVSASEVTNVGLFAEVGSAGSIASLRLTNAQISATANSYLGALAALNYGTIFNCSAQGTISASAAKFGSAGGLVGGSVGTIRNAAANVALSVESPRGKNVADAGGLVGANGGTIDESYALGSVTATGTVAADVGGLAGFSQGLIENSYAEGAAVEPKWFAAGGLVGQNYETIERSYSSGAPSNNHAGHGGPVGGLVGDDEHAVDNGFIKSTYWDTTTSGITKLSRGAGNVPHDPGIKGLSTTRLQSGLPHGFSTKIWAEDPKINGGLPYLIANPPPAN